MYELREVSRVGISRSQVYTQLLIAPLEKRKLEKHSEIQIKSNGQTAGKASEVVTIGQVRQTRTKNKQEAIGQLIGMIQTNPNATLSELVLAIGRPKSTVGGYVSELQEARSLTKGTDGWVVIEKQAS